MKKKLPRSLLNSVAKDMLAESEDAKAPAPKPNRMIWQPGALKPLEPAQKKAPEPKPEPAPEPEDRRHHLFWQPGDLADCDDDPVNEETSGVNPEDLPVEAFHSMHHHEVGEHHAVINGLKGMMAEHPFSDGEKQAFHQEIAKRRDALSKIQIGAGPNAGTYQNPRIRTEPLKEVSLDHIEPGMAAHAATFNKGHRDAIQRYKNGSKSFNMFHRTEAKGDESKLIGHKYEEQTRALDYVTSHEISAPTSVYRGFSGAYDWAKMHPGKVVQDHGFSGTSRNPDKSLGFGDTSHPDYKPNDYEGVRHVAMIHMPKGTKGYYLERHANGYDSEKEFLLARGTKYRVLHHEYVPSHSWGGSKVHVVHMQAIQDNHTPVDEEIQW